MNRELCRTESSTGPGFLREPKFLTERTLQDRGLYKTEGFNRTRTLKKDKGSVEPFRRVVSVRAATSCFAGLEALLLG
jgi:hypothetical protein